MVNERAVQVALHSWLHWRLKRIRITPNFEVGCRHKETGRVWFSSEADLIAQFAKSGRIQEFEIKCTEKDLRREFKNPRWTKFLKHDYLTRGDSDVSEFYVVTAFDPIFEIPPHCGHIRMRVEEPSGRVYFQEIVRTAPKLHDRPASPQLEKQLDATMYWRAWSYSQKIVDLERKAD